MPEAHPTKTASNTTQNGELVSTAPVATKWAVIARANRSACNSLSDEARDSLTIKAMALIYGGNGPLIPARRA